MCVCVCMHTPVSTCLWLLEVGKFFQEMAQKTVTMVGWELLRIKGDEVNWEKSGEINGSVHFLEESEPNDTQILDEMSRI